MVHSGTQSVVLKASFQKGNRDICCIVESGDLVQCESPASTKRKRNCKKHILNHTPVFTSVKVKLSKHSFAYLYHEFESVQGEHSDCTHYLHTQC